MRTIGRWIRGLISFIAFFAAVYGLAWYFFGVTTVTSKCDNQDVPAKVFVNNEYVGMTPLRARLGNGNHIIKVEPPDGYRGEHRYMEIWTFVRGMNFAETFTKIDYKVTLHSPASQHGNFMVLDGSGNPIGSCDGVVCSIPLPGPGNYRAKMERICWSDVTGRQWCNGGDDKVMDFAVNTDYPAIEQAWN